MDEAGDILLSSLKSSGVSLPDGVSSIKDLSSVALVSICSQSLRLILDSGSSSFPPSLPPATAERFKICAELAGAIKSLGYREELGFHQLLYPSDEESYKLVRFLVERLCKESSECKKVDTIREAEHLDLLTEFEEQPKLPSRKSYIERITEITKNSRKLDADIKQILKETRELQLESNSIQERLHRTHAVVDETVFREAKKDAVGRQAYRLLTSIHDSFQQIADTILATDRARREAAAQETKLAALSSRRFDVTKLQADLDSIRKENELLEQKCLKSLPI